MVKLSDVLNAAAALVAEAFPDRYVYIGQEPDQFERPSFFLELVTTNRIRQNIGTDETEIYLTLTIHEKLDTSRNGNQVSALEDMDTVLGLFRMGILRAGGRALPVAASSGGPVSYTHLDVYKRQQGRRISPAWRGWRPSR